MRSSKDLLSRWINGFHPRQSRLALRDARSCPRRRPVAVLRRRRPLRCLRCRVGPVAHRRSPAARQLLTTDRPCRDHPHRHPERLRRRRRRSLGDARAVRGLRGRRHEGRRPRARRRGRRRAVRHVRPCSSATEALQQLVSQPCARNVAVFTFNFDPHLVQYALAAGVRGYVWKGLRRNEVADALRQVAAGEIVVAAPEPDASPVPARRPCPARVGPHDPRGRGAHAARRRCLERPDRRARCSSASRRCART